MRLLLLTHRIPYPPNKGDKIRAFNITRHLAERHEVHLATLIDDPSDRAGLPELQRELGHPVLHAGIDQPARKLLSLVQVLRSASITVGHFYSARLQREVDDLIEANDFDAVVCSSSPTAEYVFRSRHASGKLRAAWKVMDLIDVDSYKWSQYADRSPPWSSWLYRYEARRLAGYELEIYRRFDRLLVVSEQEKSCFPAADSEHKLLAVSNGVDLDFFRPAESHQANEAPTLVFTGMMDYWPNIEGLRWFLESVYPAIRRALPDVRLFVVGGRPTREVLAWRAEPGVIVTGFVDDIREYLHMADVCIAPLRIARGIQNKVLEAMATGKAVVCTPEAFEGVDATSGEDLLVAANAEAFAEQTVELLQDRARAARIAANARRRMEACYAWERNLRALDEALSGGDPTHAGGIS